MERLLIKFTKNREAKFISHLDLMRTLQRAFRRADIPLSYSRGFNPHPNLSLAAPLSVGISSISEYGDVEIETNSPEDEIMGMVNKSLPQGIQILSILKINGKYPPSMSLVEAARYRIGFSDSIDKATMDELISMIMEKTDIPMVKKSKSGEKEINIRPLIIDIRQADNKEDERIIECMIYTGSKANLSPDMLVSAIKHFSNGKISGYAEITRTALYTRKLGNWIELNDYFSEE